MKLSPVTGFQKIILATILFSLNPSVFRLIELDSLTMLWAVNLVAVLCLAAMQPRRKLAGIVRMRSRAGALLILAAAFTVNNLLYISAIKITTVANSVLTHYSAPVFLFFFSFIFIREKITRSSFAALLLSLCGLTLILSRNELSFSNRDFLGLMLGTGSALFFALEILFKKILIGHFRADFIVPAYLAISVGILAPFVSLEGLLSLDPADACLLLLSGIVGSALGITLFTSGLRDVQANRAGVVSYLEPLGAIVWSALILAEFPAVATLAGGGFILAGTYLVCVRDLKPVRK